MRRTLVTALTTVVGFVGGVIAPGASANHSDDVHTTDWGTAVYDRRLPPEVVANVPGMEWRVGAFTMDAESLVPGGVAAWNSALQSSPNNLSKYPLHYLSSYNYSNSASVRVWALYSSNQLQDYCGVPAGGCVRDSNDIGDSASDFSLRPFYVFVDLNASSPASILQHELGHVLFHEEHYASNYTCDPDFDSIMNATGCNGIYSVQSHDEDDFYDGYKPADPPNPSVMTINSSASVTHWWNAGPSARHNLSGYYTVHQTDTSGTVVASEPGNAVEEFGPVKTNESYSLGSSARGCAHTLGLSDAGFFGLGAITPYGHFGCWRKWSGPQTSAGPFVATSHRAYGSVINVRNYSGASRDIRVFGPALQDVGCDLDRVGNSGTYSCEAEVGLFEYVDLGVYVWDTSGNLVASSQIDFE